MIRPQLLSNLKVSKDTPLQTIRECNVLHLRKAISQLSIMIQTHYRCQKSQFTAQCLLYRESSCYTQLS